MVELLSQDMQRVAAKAPATFAPQVKDTQKRLGLLFDHLNNGELVRPETVEMLNKVAEAIAARDYESASRGQMEILRERAEECGQWMVSSSSFPWVASW
jgi:protein transport protein SEC31